MRILILSSDTGGGHKASAEALRAALYHLHPSLVQVDIVDFWVDLAEGQFTKFPSQYTFLSKNPLLWKLVYQITRFPPARFISESYFNAFAHRNIKQAFIKYAPDLIISVHPLVNTLSQHVLNQMAQCSKLPKIPYVTVVTDLGTAHPTWFHPQVDMTYVPSEHVCAVAKRVGVPDCNIQQLGLPVRQDFWSNAPPKSVLRERLGLTNRRWVILLTGGGDGVGHLRAVITELVSTLSTSQFSNDVQLVAICGNNKRLRSYLTSTNFKIPVLAVGYVNNMSDWMAACDIICTKAGPGTIAEAFIRALPILITAFLPGQEAGNVTLVQRIGAGQFAKSPKQIAAVLMSWLSDQPLMNQMSERSRLYGKPFASLHIAADVVRVAEKKMAANLALMKKQQLLSSRQQPNIAMQGGWKRLLPTFNGLSPADIANDSHLVLRLRFAMKVVLGFVLAREALHYEDRQPGSPIADEDSLQIAD